MRPALRDVLIGLVAFVATLEVSTRIDQAIRFGAPLFGPYSYETALFEQDEQGVHGKPGGIYERWRMNRLGLRGPEANRERSPGRQRIIALGASETFGLYETEGAEWPRALEGALNRDGHLAEVLNGAVPGMSLASELRHLVGRLLPLDPDVVIWVARYDALAGLSRERLVESLASTPRRPEGPSRLAGLRPRLISRFSESLLGRLPSSLRDGIQRTRVHFELSRDRSILGAQFGSLRALSNDELAAFDEYLTRLFEAVNDSGAQLIVVFPPIRMDRRTIDLHSTAFPFIAESWMKDAMATLPGRAAAHDDAPRMQIVDLRPLFRDSVEQNMVDMVHLTDAGALAFAKAIAPCVATRRCHDVGAGGESRPH